jgi:hypothetical protein
MNSLLTFHRPLAAAWMWSLAPAGSPLSALRSPLSAAACAWSLALVCSALAGEKSLPELVPPDVGIYVEARGIAERIGQFRASPQFARLAEFAPLQKWRQSDGGALERLAGKFAEALRVEAAELWQNVLGQDMALAIWPAKAEEGGRPPAVLLLRATDERSLARVAAGFRDAQQAFEKTRWQTESHAGTEYHVGARPGKSSSLYLATLGRIGVLSESRRQFHAVLALNEGVGPEGGDQQCLARSGAYQAAAKQVSASAAVVAYLNPRPWEVLIGAEAAASASGGRQPSDRSSEKQRVEREQMLATWQALHFGVATLELQPLVRFQATIAFDPSRLPAPVADLLAVFSGPAGALENTPQDCLVAAAGRLDVGRWLRWAVKHGGAKEEPGGAAAWVVPLLRMLGPQYGVYLRSRDGGTVTTGLLDWAAAVEVRPQLSRHDLPNAKELLGAALPKLLTALAPGQHDSLLQRLADLLLGDALRLVEDGVRVSRQANFSLALAEGRLWAANTQRVAEQAAALPATASLARSPRWKRHAGPAVDAASYALFVDCAAWRALLHRHRDELVEALAQQRSLDAATARRSMERLLSLLGLADTLVAAVTIGDETLAASVSVAVDTPEPARAGVARP